MFQDSLQATYASKLDYNASTEKVTGDITSITHYVKGR